MVRLSELPARIPHTGDDASYIAALYAVFQRDFMTHQAHFGSHPLALKHYPPVSGYPHIFYHMLTHGSDEATRTLDIPRCERLPWARPTVECAHIWGLRCWEQCRSGKSRVCVELAVENGDYYYLILDVRRSYVLLWTAYYANYQHEVAKKNREYQQWLSSVGGVVKSPDELIADIQGRP